MKEKIVRLVAGSLILISLLLSQIANVHWLWLGGFVGINLFQSSISGFCPLEKILTAVGIQSKL